MAADRKNREGGPERSLERKLGGEEEDAQDGCGHNAPARLRTAGRRPGDEGRKQGEENHERNKIKATGPPSTAAAGRVRERESRVSSVNRAPKGCLPLVQAEASCGPQGQVVAALDSAPRTVGNTERC